jgi:hypothetical protein
MHLRLVFHYFSIPGLLFYDLFTLPGVIKFQFLYELESLTK